MKYIKITLAFLIAALIAVTSWVPTLAYSIHPPRASIVTREAVPAGETFVCSFTIYSANGFTESFTLSDYNIEIKGTGKAHLAGIEMTSNTGLTVTGRLTIETTYPGQIHIAIKNESFCDSAGVYNSGSVPKRVDIKIFNVDGENAYVKMTDFEFYLTVFAAPFWSVFNSIKNLFK